MDKIAEKLARWFGSTPFIVFHVIVFGLWIYLHHTKGVDRQWATLTATVGVEVIFLSLFILRAENVQSDRFKQDVRRDLKQTRQILDEVHKTSKK